MAERLLIQDLYGEEFKPFLGPFGLQSGQLRVERGFGHNATWYNALGERLGWGDLSSDDVIRIREEIPVNETFITVGENMSFRHFVTNSPMIGSMAEVRIKVMRPGIGYVAQNARFIIRKDIIYYVEFDEDIWYGVDVKGISRVEAVNLLIPPSER